MKHFRTLFIFFIVIINSVGCWRSFILNINGINCTKKSKLISHLNCSLNKINRQQNGFSINVEFAKDIPTPIIDVSFVQPRRSLPDFVVFNATDVDGCLFLENKSDFNLIRIVRQEFDKFGKLPDCPIQKGNVINIAKFYLDAHTFPAYMPETRYTSRVAVWQHKTFLFEMFVNGSSEQKNHKDVWKIRARI